LARRDSLLAARRIVDTLRYAAAVRELRGPGAEIERTSSSAGPLPGLYPDPS
jgi:hypothetical protein